MCQRVDVNWIILPSGSAQSDISKQTRTGASHEQREAEVWWHPLTPRNVSWLHWQSCICALHTLDQVNRLEDWFWSWCETVAFPPSTIWGCYQWRRQGWRWGNQWRWRQSWATLSSYKFQKKILHSVFAFVSSVHVHNDLWCTVWQLNTRNTFWKIW